LAVTNSGNSQNATFNFTFPAYSTATAVSELANDVGYLTSSTLTAYLPSDIDPYITSVASGTGTQVTTAAQIATVNILAATTTTLGGVKVAANPSAIGIQSDGTLVSQLNPVSGTGTSAVVTWNAGTSNYDFKWNLNVATSSTIGGVKQGANILIDAGTGILRQQYSTAYGQGLGSVDSTANTVTNVITRTVNANTASSSVFGVVKVDGTTITANNGVISSAGLPTSGGTMTGTLTLKGVAQTLYAWGSTSGTLAPDASSGTIHTMTLNGNLTLNALTNATTGSSMTIIVTQDATGSRTLSSTMKWASGFKTLTTSSGAIDIINVFYDGANYYAGLVRGYA
jgi:hypothetical protein